MMNWEKNTPNDLDLQIVAVKKFKQFIVHHLLQKF